jgi:hypothetical protein
LPLKSLTLLRFKVLGTRLTVRSTRRTSLYLRP